MATHPVLQMQPIRDAVRLSVGASVLGQVASPATCVRLLAVFSRNPESLWFAKTACGKILSPATLSHCDRLKSGSDFLVWEGADCKGVETGWNFGERQVMMRPRAEARTRA